MTTSSKKRHSYESRFENDLPQAKDFWRTTKRNIKNTIRKVVLGITLDQLKKDIKKKFHTRELELVTESIIVLGNDGEPLVYFLKGGLGWPFVNRNPCEDGLVALEKLRKFYPPPPPKSKDVRHLDFVHGTHQGVYHFALWHAAGHSHAANNQNKLAKGAVISKDIIDSGKKLNATMEFFHSFTSVTQAVGALFEVIDEVEYKKCKDKFDKLAKNTALSMLKISSRSCFLGTAIVAGLSCLPHRDSNDNKTGWIADMAFGDFDGGHLEVPQTGFKFELRQGDIVFMKSALLQHSVSAVERGYRYGVVFFSHESILEST